MTTITHERQSQPARCWHWTDKGKAASAATPRPSRTVSLACRVPDEIVLVVPRVTARNVHHGHDIRRRGVRDGTNLTSGLNARVRPSAAADVMDRCTEAPSRSSWPRGTPGSYSAHQQASVRSLRALGNAGVDLSWRLGSQNARPGGTSSSGAGNEPPNHQLGSIQRCKLPPRGLERASGRQIVKYCRCNFLELYKLAVISVKITQNT